MTPICVAAHAQRGRVLGLRDSGNSVDFGQSKVQHLHRAIRLDLDVGGLQVAVGDPFFVGGFQRIRYLPCDTQGFFKR
jgi:hypothetical protein